jgi:hypothetical protein
MVVNVKTVVNMKKIMKKAADGIRMKPSSAFTPSKISKELNFKKSEPIDFSYKPAAKKVETKPIKKTRVEKVEEYKPRTQSQQSAPIYSCDRSAINVSGTTDFSKCKKLSGDV